MIVYKIVNKSANLDNGEFVSCRMNGYIRSQVFYNIGKFSVPPKVLFDLGYGLLCFKTIKQCEQFICETNWILSSEQSKDLIFKAEAKNRMKLKSYQIREGLYKEEPIIYSTQKFPIGSMMFEKVKLLKQVK
jgi:hypothetical protein